jgi:hypothetical protein
MMEWLAVFIIALIAFVVFTTRLGTRRLIAIQEEMALRRASLAGKSPGEIEYGTYLLDGLYERMIAVVQHMGSGGANFMAREANATFARFDRAVSVPPIDEQYLKATGKTVDEAAKDYYERQLFSTEKLDWNTAKEKSWVRNMIRNWWLFNQEHEARVAAKSRPRPF